MIKSKKIISIAAAAVLGLSALALTGCDDGGYKGEKLDGYVSAATVSSNGGFAVEKGDYVYFINGQEDSTADNTYGKAVKGALMRISKADLAAGKGEEAKIVVPSLFVTANYESGIYIYGDYVYYATPTTDKNKDGQIANGSLDFKRAKLDGSEAPMGDKKEYFFRLQTNSVKYRFVEEDNGEVYCLYEDGSTLKSYSVKTGDTTVLVSGASSFYYDKTDLASPVVYYTMSVSNELDKTTPTQQKYNQVFSVRAGNTAVVNKAAASYKAKTVSGEVVAEYNFDEKFMKDNADEKGYKLGDYTTYPYVNLGELVLDGIGTMHDFPSHVVMTKADKEKKAEADEKQGYTYTIRAQENGGLYFTRALVNAVTGEKEKLCYVPNKRTSWNEITGNAQVDVITTDLTSASATALYAIDGGVHSYIYISDSVMKKTVCKASGVETTTIAYGLSGETLWKLDGSYVYYTGSADNGKSVIRLDHTGSQEDYDFLGNEDVYAPVTVSFVDFADSWYVPEIFTVNGKQILLFNSAKSYGSTSVAHNYVHAVELGDNAALKTIGEKLEAINEYIDDYDNAALQALMRCYFRTGSAATYDTDEAVRELYSDEQVKEFNAFKKKFGEGEEFENSFEGNYLFLIGRMNEEDAEAVEEAWASYLLTEEEEETDESGLEGWAIALIVVGSVLAVAAGVTVPLVIVLKRKKARKAREAAIVGAYRHKKLDTTDDKSIDVYADEEKPAEESAEVSEEESAEELVQE